MTLNIHFIRDAEPPPLLTIKFYNLSGFLIGSLLGAYVAVPPLWVILSLLGVL